MDASIARPSMVGLSSSRTQPRLNGARATRAPPRYRNHRGPGTRNLCFSPIRATAISTVRARRAPRDSKRRYCITVFGRPGSCWCCCAFYGMVLSAGRHQAPVVRTIHSLMGIACRCRKSESRLYFRGNDYNSAVTALFQSHSGEPVVTIATRRSRSSRDCGVDRRRCPSGSRRDRRGVAAVR